MHIMSLACLGDEEPRVVNGEVGGGPKGTAGLKSPVLSGSVLCSSGEWKCVGSCSCSSKCVCGLCIV